MGRLEDDLKKLRARIETQGLGTPWYSLPPGVEPDWPRPLRHLSDEALEVLFNRDIVRYGLAEEGVEGRRSTMEETYTSQEVWHEYRWRNHGMRRRMQGMSEPLGWDPPTEQEIHEYLGTPEGQEVLRLLEEGGE